MSKKLSTELYLSSGSRRLGDLAAALEAKLEAMERALGLAFRLEPQLSAHPRLVEFAVLAAARIMEEQGE